MSKIPNNIEKHRRLATWQPFFCWLPMNVEGKKCWLMYIERRGRYVDYKNKCIWEFTYRLKK